MALHKPPYGAKVKLREQVPQPAAPPRKKWAMPRGELAQRAIGAALVVICILPGIYFGGWVWNTIASLIALGSLMELYKLLQSKHRISKGWGLAGGIAILVFVSLNFSYALSLSTITLVAMLVLFTEIVRRQSSGVSFALSNVGGTIFGLVYIVLPWSFMILIRSATNGHIFLFTIFLCTWSCDTAANIIGSRWGSTPFCPKVSPKKSWEGFWAGFSASLVCGSALPIYFDFAPIPLVLLGAICGIAGQFGDLGESVLKREAGVKDTGSVIPGHGGFLDRFDSILINASIAFFIIESVS
jgi:phosphatidate cytidylyltransferase